MNETKKNSIYCSQRKSMVFRKPRVEAVLRSRECLSVWKIIKSQLRKEMIIGNWKEQFQRMMGIGAWLKRVECWNEEKNRDSLFLKDPLSKIMLWRAVEELEMWSALCFLFLLQKKSRGWLKWKKEEKKKNQWSEMIQNQMEVIKNNKIIGFLRIF